MSKWNKPLFRDTKVKSYYNVSKENLQKRVNMFDILSKYLKETNDFEICNSLRGLIHGSNISNSFTLENIFEETVNSSCNNLVASARVENKYEGRESNIDVVVTNEITGRKIYCEIKNGGINATFNSKHKAADYIERFKNSGCDEFIILTVEDDQLQGYWKTFVDLYISEQIAYNNCVKIGSNEFLEVFPGFNTESFLSRVKEDGNSKITSNIAEHIDALESLLNEEVV
jgi:hypothetical protein